MTIAFKCTECGRALRANPEMAGKRTKCPGCATVMTIPAAAEPAAPKPPAAKTSPSVAPPSPAAASAPVVTCECGAKIRTKPEWAGKTIKCPKCEGRIKVPAAAAPAPARPAPKPVAPPPEDDPFASGGFGDNDEAFGGGGSFNDGGDSGDDEPSPAPSRKKPAPAPKKKGGGGRVILYSLLGLILAGGAGFAFWAFVLNEQPTVVPGPKLPIPKDKGKEADDDDDMDQKKPAPVDGKKPAPTDNGDDKKPDVPVAKGEKPAAKTPATGGALGLVSADALAFFKIKPQHLFKTALGKKLLAKLDGDNEFAKSHKQSVEAFGVGLGDIDEIVWVMKEMPRPGPDFPGLIIISTSKEIKSAGFDTEMDGKKYEKTMTPKGVAYYLVPSPGPAPMAVAQTAPNIMVTSGEAQLVKYLDSQPAQEGLLAPAIKNAAAGDPLLFVGFKSPPELSKMILSMPEKERSLAMPFAELKTGQLSIAADSSIKALAKLNFDDAAMAAKARKTLDAFLTIGEGFLPGLKDVVPPDFAKLIPVAEEAFKTIQPNVSGKTVEIPLEVKLSLDDIGAILEPMIEKALGAAKQAEGLKKLLQLALSMHQYHDNFKSLPPAKVGPDLSWRVAILPFVEQDSLYKEFKLDESWDSEHNARLLEKMPKVFEHPTRKSAPGHTYYRVFVGPGTIFEDGTKKMRLARIADGTSNTLMIVEGADAVPWTKFDELVFNPAGPLPKLGDGKSIIVSFADSSIQVLGAEFPAETLKALITANGGEPIDRFGKVNAEPVPKVKIDEKIDDLKEKKDVPFDPLKAPAPGLKLPPPGDGAFIADDFVGQALQAASAARR